MYETRLPGKVLKCVPQEKSKLGRLSRGWRDDMKEAMKVRESLKKIVIEGKSGDSAETFEQDLFYLHYSMKQSDLRYLVIYVST